MSQQSLLPCSIPEGYSGGTQGLLHSVVYNPDLSEYRGIIITHEGCLVDVPIYDIEIPVTIQKVCPTPSQN